MAAKADDIKEGLKHFASTSKYKGKMTQMSTTAFSSLIGELNAWLEQKDKETIQSDDDKKLVARVITHDASVAATYIPTPNGLIGTYAKNMLPALVTVSVSGPAYTNLTQSYSFKEWPAVRADVARVLGIVDKTHSSHGANFKGSLTLKQVIDNVTATVQGADQKAKVAALIKKNYPLYQ